VRIKILKVLQLAFFVSSVREMFHQFTQAMYRLFGPRFEDLGWVPWPKTREAAAERANMVFEFYRKRGQLYMIRCAGVPVEEARKAYVDGQVLFCCPPAPKE
jgi:hypothetical protein